MGLFRILGPGPGEKWRLETSERGAVPLTLDAGFRRAAVSLPDPIPVYSVRPGKGADSPGLTLARRVCRTDCAGGALGSPMFLFIYPDFSIRYIDLAIYLL